MSTVVPEDIMGRPPSRGSDGLHHDDGEEIKMRIRRKRNK